MKRIAALVSLLVYSLAFSVGNLSTAFAATPPSTNAPAANGPGGQALEIAPPVLNLNANPGQTVTAQIYLRNISGGTLIVSSQANDFVAAGEDGTPKLLLEDKGNNPYSLKRWIGQIPKLTIAPREIKTLSVQIKVPADGQPGGHYGVIRFTGTPADLKTTGVSLSASLGALILLTVNGQTNEKLSVTEFSASHNKSKGSLFEAAPIDFLVRIKNEGNVHEQPTGQITVKNMFGKKIGAVNVNLPPRNILPSSTRKFEQSLDKTVLGNKRLFGHYKADLEMTYGANKQKLTSSLGFWVIPVRLVLGVAIALVAAFFGLRYLIKWYNRRIIARSRHQ